jgi:hypothetical protein
MKSLNFGKIGKIRKVIWGCDSSFGISFIKYIHVLVKSIFLIIHMLVFWNKKTKNQINF